MRLTLIALAFLTLTACASTQARQFVGQDVQEAMIDMGAPVNQFDMADGRRAFQFRWGGGTYVVPGTSTATATTMGGITTVQTVGTPGYVGESEGCLITLIARENSGRWIVEDYRIPRGLTCG